MGTHLSKFHLTGMDPQFSKNTDEPSKDELQEINIEDLIGSFNHKIQVFEGLEDPIDVSIFAKSTWIIKSNKFKKLDQDPKIKLPIRRITSEDELKLRGPIKNKLSFDGVVSASGAPNK